VNWTPLSTSSARKLRSSASDCGDWVKRTMANYKFYLPVPRQFQQLTRTYGLSPLACKPLDSEHDPKCTPICMAITMRFATMRQLAQVGISGGYLWHPWSWLWLGVVGRHPIRCRRTGRLRGRLPAPRPTRLPVVPPSSRRPGVRRETAGRRAPCWRL
jgi:hypothetical protein